MTKNQIIAAINGDDYQVLLSIYNKYKINNKFDEFFAQQKNPPKEHMHFSLLLGKVKDIFRKLSQTDGFDVNNEISAQNVLENNEPTRDPIIIKTLDFKNQKSKSIERVIVDSNPHVNRDELSEEMQKLYDDNGRMNQEMKSKHSLMKNEPDTEKRKILVNELAALEDLINANWSKIDSWYQEFKNGNKDSESSKQLTELEMSNKIQAAKKYMDRYFDSKNPKTIAKFNEYKTFMLGLGNDYVPRPLRDDKRQTRSSNTK